MVCAVLMLIQVYITLRYKQQNRLKIWWMPFIKWSRKWWLQLYWTVLQSDENQ